MKNKWQRIGAIGGISSAVLLALILIVGTMVAQASIPENGTHPHLSPAVSALLTYSAWATGAGIVAGLFTFAYGRMIEK